MRIKNLPSIESMDGSQDALVIEQTDGSEDKSRKVSPAQIKQYVLGNSIDDIYSVMGQNGAKNLIPYPYYQTTQTVNGITVTDNGDGSITVNGTATATGVVFRYLSNDSNIEIPLERKKYKLTFGSNAGSSEFHLGDVSLIKTDSTTQTINMQGDAEIDNSNGDYVGIFAMGVYIVKNRVIDNVTLYPMLRLAEDTDNTYQPYAKTNRQLTEDKAEVESVRDYVNELGVKNLIPYPYNETTKVDHGVTFTVNNDGTVIANGTANGTAQLYLVLGNVSLSAAGNLVINTNKPLFLSGCPSGGGNTTYRIQYGLTDGTTYWAKTASDTGSGVKITPVDGLNTYCFAVIKIMVFDGYTANNLTFKPMLRLAADINDDTYVQYAMTNKQLTDKLEKCWKLDAGTVIPDNSDLNDYKTPGNYYHLTANVSTISNIPVNNGFRLTVLLDLYDPAWVEQIFNPIGSYKTYKRYYSTSNTWTDWKVVEDDLSGKANTSDIPTALSQLSGDSTHRLVTDAEKTAWNTAKNRVEANTFGNSVSLKSYSSATNKYIVPNDGYITVYAGNGTEFRLIFDSASVGFEAMRISSTDGYTRQSIFVKKGIKVYGYPVPVSASTYEFDYYPLQ